MLFALLILSLTAAQPGASEVKPAKDAPQPLSPHESSARMKLPPGFRLDLVASEPLIQDPSCIAFDERGRLFVCELHGYNIEGHLDVRQLNQTGVLDNKVRRLRWELIGGKIAEQARKLQFGIVKLLTDTNNDTVMDKAEVWAKDLPPCYGLVAARGGVIVACAPEIVFLADRDGDGKAEVRQTLYSGFRRRTMERGINNPRWGLDNWIYVGAGGEGGLIRGPHLAQPVRLGQTDFRIKADGSAIEPVNGRVGTYGLAINEVGDRFPSSGGQPAIYALPLPHRYLARNPFVATPPTNHSAADYSSGFRISKPHPWRVKRRLNPAWVKFYGERETNSSYFTGGCGGEVYQGDLFAPEFRGNFFCCEPSLNIVHRCILLRDGAGYRGQRAENERQSEFLASTDPWFRPINLRMGPDGALYIVDMYREIIEDYSAIPRFLQQQYGLNKGSDRGRIWRLAPKSAPRRQFTNLGKLNDRELVIATGSPNAWRRLTAQRLLIERGARSAAASLRHQIRRGETPQAKIHALYTLDGLNRLRPQDVGIALADKDFGVRMHGLRLADGRFNSNQQLLTKAIQLTQDQDPRVRLQLAMSLGESHGSQAIAALLNLAKRQGDERWMASAILSSSKEIAGPLLMGLLTEVQPSKAANALLKPLATTLAGGRDSEHIALVMSRMDGLDQTSQAAILEGLIAGFSRGSATIPQSKDGWPSLIKMVRNESKEVRLLAAKCAALLSLTDNAELRVVFAEAAQNALDDQRSTKQRRFAVQILANAPYATLTPVAINLLDARQPPELQQAAIEALGASNDDRVGAVLLKSWEGLTPQTRKAVLETIFARASRLPALLNAIQSNLVRRGDVSAIQREQLTKNRDRQIAHRAQKLFANAESGVELRQRIARYQKALAGPPDLDRGKQVFVKHCLACHKLAGDGHEVGPPLGGVIDKPDEAILLDILDPSGHIESEFGAYIVVTKQGRTFTGLLASESATSVTLRKEKGVNQTVLRQDIEIIKSSDVSLMPANLHEQIKPKETNDLIGFLRQAFAAKQ